jgi:hypothetical protein
MSEEPRITQSATAGDNSIIIQVGRDNNGHITVTFINSGEVIRTKIPSLPQPSLVRVDFNNQIGIVLKKLETNNVVQIHGLPGVGKTLLAQHVAHQHQANYDLGVAWLSARAESESLAGTTSMELDKVLEGLTRRIVEQFLNLQEAKGDITGYARSLLRSGKCLLVLDNLESRELLEQLIQQLNPKHLLVTSQHQATLLPEVEPHALEVLSLQEAITLYQRDANDETSSEKDITTIVQMLGRLPLAVTVVGSKRQSVPT